MWARRFQIRYGKGEGEGRLLMSVSTNAARWHSKPASWRSAGFFFLKGRAGDFETLK